MPPSEHELRLRERLSRLRATPLLGGVIAYFYGWRAPFFFFAIPTAMRTNADVLTYGLRW